jgi:hypothetical protein
MPEKLFDQMNSIHLFWIQNQRNKILVIINNPDIDTNSTILNIIRYFNNQFLSQNSLVMNLLPNSIKIKNFIIQSLVSKTPIF